MKRITLLCALMMTYAAINAQNNPCPDIQSHGFSPISTSGANCTSKVFAYATGDVASQKSLQITVYVGAVAPENIVAQSCNIVPANSPSTYYESGSFTVACDAPITYVLRRGTSSNGSCGGGECGVTINVQGGPLPIKLGAFYAQRNSNIVLLSWKTESEINAKSFVIQRSVNNDFKDISTIAATNRSNGSSYSFTDMNPERTLASYRLKMVDLDGSFAYSEIRAVKGSATAASDFIIFPNPNRGNAKVTVYDISSPTDVQLIDQSGRVIKAVSLKNTNTIDFNNLQTGMYIIRVVNKTTGETSTQKLNVIN
jgi:hypothetical protein